MRYDLKKQEIEMERASQESALGGDAQAVPAASEPKGITGSVV